MPKHRFEWDDAKEAQNITKHGVDFVLAQEAFFDPQRVIARDEVHSLTETRYYCFGRVADRILTVRFVLRSRAIRIIGAGYWAKGREAYEKANQIQ